MTGGFEGSVFKSAPPGDHIPLGGAALFGATAG
jgi:hypothetical protein